MNRDIQMKYEVVQDAIMAFSEEQRNMQALEDALSTDVRSLTESGWSGDAAQTFSAKYFGETNQRLNEFADLLGKIVSVLQQAMEEMRLADQQAAQAQAEG